MWNLRRFVALRLADHYNMQGMEYMQLEKITDLQKRLNLPLSYPNTPYLYTDDGDFCSGLTGQGYGWDTAKRTQQDPSPLSSGSRWLSGGRQASQPQMR